MSKLGPTGFESTGTTTAKAQNETNSEIDWDGPFIKRTAYGTTTGYTYVRCPECRIEVLTSGRDTATHREGCLHR